MYNNIAECNEEDDLFIFGFSKTNSSLGGSLVLLHRTHMQTRVLTACLEVGWIAEGGVGRYLEEGAGVWGRGGCKAVVSLENWGLPSSQWFAKSPGW